MRRCAIASAAVLFVLAGGVGADGLIQQLPPDGSFALYRMEVRIKEGKRDTKQAGHLKLSSVGRLTVDGQPCRWLELKLKENGAKRVFLAKLLIPEKDLKRGESPIDHILKAWRGDPNGKSDKIRNFKHSVAFSVAALFAGPLAEEKKLPAVPIECGLGKLSCDGIKGVIREKEGDRDIEIQVESRLNPKAPFGVVRTHMDFQMKRGGAVAASGALTLTLEQAGTGARSEVAEPK